MKYILLFIFTTFSILAFAQNSVSSAVKSKIEAMDLEFFEPLEQKFKFKKGGKNRFFTFDLKLLERKSKQEIFVILRLEDGEDDIVQFPHVEFTRLMANLATNDQEKDIMVITHDTKKSLIKSSDWGAEAYFTIRKEISMYPNAKLVSFYKEGKGLVSILYCFDDPEFLPDLLSFKKSSLPDEEF